MSVDDKDVLVFHDVLGQDAPAADSTPHPAASVSGSQPASAQQQQPTGARGPSEDSPLKADQGGQVGPKRPSVECCGYGMGAVILVSAASILALALTIGLLVSIRYGPPQIPPSGAVVSPAKECSDIGLKIIREKKGSAAEAAIAMALCLGVVRAESSGLGGDGFAIYHNHRHSVDLTWNGRSCSPKNVGELEKIEKIEDFEKYRLTGWAVATPMEIALFWNIHQKFHKLSWSELFTDTIKLANDGFEMKPETESILKTLEKKDIETLRSRNSGLADKYFLENNTVRPAGTKIKRPDLAKLLEAISQSDQGNRYLYEKDQGKKLIAAINKWAPSGKKGLFSDKSNFTSLKCMKNLRAARPEQSEFKEFNLKYPGWPSAGAAVGEILEILSMANITKEKVDFTSGEIYQHLIEAAKFAFADVYLDLLPSGKHTENNTKLHYENLRLKLGKGDKDWKYYGDGTNLKSLPRVETTGNFVAALDEEEAYVAMTMSLGSPFGSMVVTEDGVILNNHMEAFYYDKDLRRHRNAIKAEAQPLSMQAPIVAHVPQSCKIRTAVGAVPFFNGSNAGGKATSGWYTVPTVSEALLRLLAGGSSSPNFAVKNWRSSPLPLTGNDSSILLVETDETVKPKDSIVSDLKSKGQTVTPLSDNYLSIVAALSKVVDKINIGETDPRAESMESQYFG